MERVKIQNNSCTVSVLTASQGCRYAVKDFLRICLKSGSLKIYVFNEIFFAYSSSLSDTAVKYGVVKITKDEFPN